MMVKVMPFKAEVKQALALLDEALTGADAGDALLEKHARSNAGIDDINIPEQERVLGEAASLIKRWTSRVAALLDDFDVATTDAHLQFERLFDEHAGKAKGSFIRRRMRFGQANPRAILADLVGLLSASAVLDGTLSGLRPMVQRRHRQGEANLLRIIERRRRLDFEIEEAQRRIDVLRPKIADRLLRRGSTLGVVSVSAFEQEIKSLEDERDACLARESLLRPERATSQQLITLYEDYVDALNAHVGMLNAIRTKLAVDIEQRIALMKAVSAATGAAPGDLPPPVAALVEAFDASALSGYALMDRKARVDEAFARRLHPRPIPPPEVSEPAPAAEPAATGEPASGQGQ
jgi:hypothetical protein